MAFPIAIRTENLSKSFGRLKKKRIQAVKTLNLEVPTGQIYGFLGPNGAGKTTTIRMLLDLIYPSFGEVYLFGKHIRREHDVLRRVGSLVEGASFYNFLTGRRNLEVFALYSNLDLPQAHFDEVLEIVDMKDQAARQEGIFYWHEAAFGHRSSNTDRSRSGYLGRTYQRSRSTRDRGNPGFDPQVEE